MSLQSKQTEARLARAVGLFSLLMTLVFAVAMLINPAFLLAAGAVGLADSPQVVGALTDESVDKADKNHIAPDIEKAVTKIRSAEFPMDTLSRRLTKRQNAKNVKVEWEEVDMRGRVTTTTGATSDQSGGDYTIIRIPVANVKMFTPSSVVTFTDADSVEHQAFVTSVDYGNGTIDCGVQYDSDDSSITPPTFATGGLAVGSNVIRSSNAHAELDAQTVGVTNLPQRYHNYVQTFMGQVEISKDHQTTKTFNNFDDWADQVEQAIYDFKFSANNALLFGKKSKNEFTQDNKTKTIYTTDGVWNMAGKQQTYDPSAFGRNDLISLAKYTFVDNIGSKERYFLMGADLLETILKNISTSKDLRAKEVELVDGIICEQISFNYGRLNMIHDPSFDAMNRSEQGIVLDFTNLGTRIRKPMEKIELDLDTSGQRRVKAHRILESKAMVTKYRDTHVRVVAS